MVKITSSIIDGDVLLYQCCRGAERDADFGDITILFSSFEEVKDLFERKLENIEKQVEVPIGSIMFSDSENWRKSVMSTYKNNRKDVRRPVAFKRLREWAEETYPCVVLPRLEADDAMGLLREEDQIIVSIDKDMGTVPGWFGHLNLDGDIRISCITENAARYSHMVQAFMGDRTDGYPGCPGIGKKTAEKLLNKVVSTPGLIKEDEWLKAWNMVVHHYETQQLTVSDAVENFMVSKILWHPGEYDVTTAEVRITLPMSVDYIV